MNASSTSAKAAGSMSMSAMVSWEPVREDRYRNRFRRIVLLRNEQIYVSTVSI